MIGAKKSIRARARWILQGLEEGGKKGRKKGGDGPAAARPGTALGALSPPLPLRPPPASATPASHGGAARLQKKWGGEKKGIKNDIGRIRTCANKDNGLNVAP